MSLFLGICGDVCEVFPFAGSRRVSQENGPRLVILQYVADTFWVAAQLHFDGVDLLQPCGVVAKRSFEVRGLSWAQGR